MDPRERKLKMRLWPYFISIAQLRRQHIVRCYTFHRYTNEVLAALIALGIAPPIVGLVANNPTANQRADGAQILASLKSGWAFWGAVALLAAWVLFKAYLRNENAEKKYNLIKTCESRCSIIKKNCRDAIHTEDPSRILDQEHSNLMEIVNLCQNEGAWPVHWDPFAPGAEEKAKVEVDRLIADPMKELWCASEGEQRRDKTPRAAVLAELHAA